MLNLLILASNAECYLSNSSLELLPCMTPKRSTENTCYFIYAEFIPPLATMEHSVHERTHIHYIPRNASLRQRAGVYYPSAVQNDHKCHHRQWCRVLDVDKDFIDRNWNSPLKLWLILLTLKQLRKLSVIQISDQLTLKNFLSNHLS